MSTDHDDRSAAHEYMMLAMTAADEYVMRNSSPQTTELNRHRCLWCYRCQRRTLFPGAHYALHMADVLRRQR